MQIVERFVLAKLRNQRFFSLAELNSGIRDCVAAKTRAQDIDADVMQSTKSLPSACPVCS